MNQKEPAYLTVRGGHEGGRRIPLPDGAAVLGRGPANDVDLDDETVSRRHSVVFETAHGFVLRDLGSANGTFVNRDKVKEQDHVLKHSDRIRLGGDSVTLVFQQKGPDTVEMSKVSAPEAVEDAEEEDQSPKEPTEQRIEDQQQDMDSNLLRLLETNKGMAVGREDIARLVWPEVPLESILGSQEIERSVLRLRHRLKDDPRRPKQLITVGEFGYLLV